MNRRNYFTTKRKFPFHTNRRRLLVGHITTEADRHTHTNKHTRPSRQTLAQRTSLRSTCDEHPACLRSRRRIASPGDKPTASTGATAYTRRARQYPVHYNAPHNRTNHSEGLNAIRNEPSDPFPSLHSPGPFEGREGPGRETHSQPDGMHARPASSFASRARPLATMPV